MSFIMAQNYCLLMGMIFGHESRIISFSECIPRFEEELPNLVELGIPVIISK